MVFRSQGEVSGLGRSQCLMGTEFQFCKMKSSGDGWWCWLPDSVKVLHTTKLHALKWLR